MSVQRSVIQSLPIPSHPGWENQLVLLIYPPGTSATPHIHPVPGMTFIVKGRMISHYEGHEEREYGEGDTFIDHANTLHIKVANASETEELRAIVSYVVKKGEPTSVAA